MMRNNRKIYLFAIAIIMIVPSVLTGTVISVRAAQQPVDENPLHDYEDTMLMFVGEDVERLSIASRRQERVWDAPAIADVITRKKIRELGAQTLADVLETVPGFYMAPMEWGTRPYLRGIPDSVLFLYDTVPVFSEISKSIHQLDHELSLAPIKRIEIVKGPGSVLWGPDAFAGIVNVVPMTGEDMDGIETGLVYGSPGRHTGFFTNMGYANDTYDAFFSVSGHSGEEDDTRCNLVNFWGENDMPVNPEKRFGEEMPGESNYLEAFGRVELGDWLIVSGRISDNDRPYAMTNVEDGVTWKERRSTPADWIRMEAKTALDRKSILRFTGLASWLRPEYEIVGRNFKKKEHTLYGEALYDRTFFNDNSNFTGGFSYRKKWVRGAPVWDSYLPEYLGSDNPFLLPAISEENYDAALLGFFGQYTHKVGPLDMIAGVRYDEHSDYRDHVSYNVGLVWNPSPSWVYKLLYGTAYRTPFAAQLLQSDQFAGIEPDLEKVKNLGIQVSWEPDPRVELSLYGFYSRIDNHVFEDIYAGLSQPNHQDIRGIEIEGSLRLPKNIELSANLTLLENNGPDETYKYLDYIFIDPEDGTETRFYNDLVYPYDTGPDTLCNIMGVWRPDKRITTLVHLGYTASQKLIYRRDDSFVVDSGSEAHWILNANTIFKDVFWQGFDVTVSLKNLADRKYRTAGTYHYIDGKPFSAEIVFTKRW